MLRSEYGSNIVSNFVATAGFENNNSLGNLLPSFNTDIDCSWNLFCHIADYSILANIRDAITSYNCRFADGLFIFNSFHSLAVLKIFEEYISEDNISVV